ncbi:MAG: transketolase [Alphaproteobacteria bacterium]|jgi:transketolase|nr:transketolase [Alphaproteobacteria bacterium]MDP7182759.1 transketolase [Alphaproteobacteria bacterium]MDP7190709.1 transketolase [Alphaproteobacteria bacterium]HJO89037.1 transketolase [Alphaproteobacteria bacterium]
MANAIRALAMDAVEQANSGHPGMPLGMADVATVLFTRFLKFDAAMPRWADRDRFVLSAGHGSMLLYALAYLTGQKDMGIDQIRNFRQLGSRTAGHPEYGLASCIETTTGPLGQGIANAVGMAIAERMMAARFGELLVNHYTYVIAGDGCLMEGISHEAISIAGHLKLGKLIMLFDDNDITIDGPTGITVSDDQQARFKACGWDVRNVDGHDSETITAAIGEARATDTPSLISCSTTIGFGAPNKQGTAAAHGAPLGADEVTATREALGWEAPPFEIPAPILAAWRASGSRGRGEREAWDARLAKDANGDTFTRRMCGELTEGWEAALTTFKEALATEAPKWATRKSSHEVLEVMTAALPEMVGGSADLTGSNQTKTKAQTPITRDDFSGGYIYYGVREHAMAAAMNGIALHGGFVPYGGTFLIFTDYCRNSIRLSAMMKQRVVYVMTHDSIGLGEDGPTHQPVEHLATLRAIPNLYVLRPADAMETAECWEIALKRADGPSVLSLSRQGLPALRKEVTAENLCSRGGYILAEADGDPHATILASGSEVEIALAARNILQTDGIPARVVSLPCWEAFDAQPQNYRCKILGENTVRVAVEAATTFGWERYVGNDGTAIGINSFGESAPASVLYEHFGITAEAVADAVKARLGSA